MSRLNQYIYNKRGRWQYTHRVPSEVSYLDKDGAIPVGLETASLDVARHRRDAKVLVNDEYGAPWLLHSESQKLVCFISIWVLVFKKTGLERSQSWL